MKRIAEVAVVLVVGVFLVVPAYALELGEIEPYTKVGSIKWTEKGIEEGHKFLLGAGARVNFEASNLEGTIAAEKWHMAEALDEDKEIPKRGISVSGEIRYRIEPRSRDLKFSPYTGIEFQKWERVESKYEGSWSTLELFALKAGAKGEYKKIYARGGIGLPFGIESNARTDPTSKLGYEAEVGISLWKGLVLGLFYKKTRLGNSELELSGAFLSYRF